MGFGSGDYDLVNKYLMNIYFESSATILTLITLGKYFEAKAKKRTSDAISRLVNLAPNSATVIREGKEQVIDIDDICVSDILVIKPGESIPVDGVLVEGYSLINESSITGESLPVEKNIGSNVISGTINTTGYFKMKATKVGEDTTLSQIIRLVEEASNSKAPISKLADRVSSVFVPLVILIAIIAGVFWYIYSGSFELALNFLIAVLVISCPCALGLATPVAIMVATGKAAKNGVLIKSAESLEILHLVDTVVLDKTGTITTGKMQVTDVNSFIEENEFLKLAYILEKNSEHPLANAIVKYIEDLNILDNNEKIKFEEFKSITGKGVEGILKNVKYYAGNAKLMKDNNIDMESIKDVSNKLLKELKTVI